MFQIIDENANLIAQVDSPRYVRLNDNGVWIRCPPYDAQCVAVNGVRYSLVGKDIVEDAPTVVFVRELDSANEVLKTNQSVATNTNDINLLSWAMAQMTKEIVDKLSFGVSTD